MYRRYEYQYGYRFNTSSKYRVSVSIKSIFKYRVSINSKIEYRTHLCLFDILAPICLKDFCDLVEECLGIEIAFDE